MGGISIGMEITVKSLEEVVKVIIPDNYPTTLFLFPSSYKYYYSLLNVRFGSLLGPRGLLLIYMWGENSI